MTRKFTDSELVLATHNKGKLAEFRDMMDDNAPKLYTASDFGLKSPPETGTTFVENATLKAVFVAKATGKVAMADDSGICIAALGGEPGLYSADWAEKADGTRDFKWAIEKVLAKMGDNPDRSAEFVSVIVLAWPDGHCEVTEGIVAGDIVSPPRGKEGHGYDPVFKPAGYDVTYAEMSTAQKNSISHRAVAFRKMMDLCFR